jgi:hypothetical protein
VKELVDPIAIVSYLCTFSAEVKDAAIFEETTFQRKYILTTYQAGSASGLRASHLSFKNPYMAKSTPAYGMMPRLDAPRPWKIKTHVTKVLCFRLQYRMEERSHKRRSN